MRARRLSLGLLLIATVGGIVLLARPRPAAQTVVLPDGSQLTFLKVTHGTNHAFRFDHRWQDFLYPILPAKLRVRLSARVMEWSSYNRDSVMVWLRRDGLPSSGVEATRIYLSAADEHGLESPMQLSAHTTRTPGSTPAKTNAVTTQISGWELSGFPKRSRKFKILVHHPTPTELARVGEFHIPNPVRRQFPVWNAESLPVTRRTNSLEVILTKLETGMAGRPAGVMPVSMAARDFSRATFKLRENGRPTEAWGVTRTRFTSATGETRLGDVKDTRWWHGEHTADVWGGIWLEEPAWKLEVDFARAADFPAEDVWGINGVRMPQQGERVESRVQTNLHAVTLEFLGVSGLKAAFPADQVMPAYVVVHIRTPHPLEHLRVVLVEVRDDRGNLAEPHGSSNVIGTGAGGNTPKESLIDFRVAIPLGAKSLDIRLAAAPIHHVEFLAKPVMFAPPAKTAD